ncbi:MAG: 2-octaprenyl-6-methoxyphenyl hydroxylase [Candidatus Thiodiazotropha sp. (ex Myrtea spinifera)]|nr:2-octaprenyl-6-methoxyphenyl hydroxylase [Candidatus Thiodiazotropha sp. (ex Myrtea spinifera)]MCU7828912.1 2-octaprenyl-6-methoxyphenyl hydroxylase [Candidatus Thiodiazotropha sp. (ex Myrtea sp. 'scaly one' KF741663)]
MSAEFDLLIIGGGMVGASLARAVSGQGLRIGIVEAFSLASNVQPSFDDRVIALSWGSRKILQAIGMWGEMAKSAEPIHRIHISDRGHFGFTHLDRHEEGVDALGYVATARAMGEVLQKNLADLPDVEFICPAKLRHFTVSGDRVDVTLAVDGDIREINSKLLVAADGGDSQVRTMLSIPLKEQAYGQTAIIANLTTAKPHEGMAYERFTDSGPLAMLPMTEGRVSMVWTAKDDQVDGLMSLSDQAFLDHLQDRFGYRLGRMESIGERVSYPLRLRQATEQISNRVALIGNAAHTIHPVTGQGFNLGLRDVAVLADLLSDAAVSKQDPGERSLLESYEKWRQRDQQAVALITDSLARLFANPLGPLRVARNLGLLGLDSLPSLKHLVARQFMGVNGRLPRLARGVSLD